MPGLLEQHLSDPDWIFTSVVVGLLVSIVGNWLTKGVTSLLVRLARASRDGVLLSLKNWHRETVDTRRDVRLYMIHGKKLGEAAGIARLQGLYLRDEIGGMASVIYLWATVLFFYYGWPELGAGALWFWGAPLAGAARRTLVRESLEEALFIETDLPISFFDVSSRRAKELRRMKHDVEEAVAKHLAEQRGGSPTSGGETSRKPTSTST